MAGLDWVRKIYEDGMHCAFTDLVKWHGHYYCSFRHAERHAVLPYGDIWVIRSADLENWAVCGTLTTGLDDRDPAMAPDGDRLWVYFGSRYRETDGTGQAVEGGKRWLQSHASYTTDGMSWHVPIPIWKRNYWLWHPYRFEDGFYCAAYGEDPATRDGVLDFLKSDDGSQWTHVARMMADNEADETGLYRYPDGHILAAIRSGSNSTGTHFMEAEPPYDKWTRWSVAHEMHAPILAQVGDALVGAGRSYAETPSGDSGKRGRPVAAVYLIKPEENATEHVMDLPSGGDTSYCGMIVQDERTLLISYYSQHEHLGQPGFVTAQKPAAIYLARVSF